MFVFNDMTTFKPYKLSCSLVGHSMDVRCVAAAIAPSYSSTALEAVVTGSRDRTAKLWTRDGIGGYRETQTLRGHANFVSCVCIAPPDDQYPNGFILTGSNDKTICAFAIDDNHVSSEPVYRLIGHENTVCSLDADKFGTVLSGSWDQTARVWLNQKCVLTLSGHAATVWAVAIVGHEGVMLTASADKTIKQWKAGQCQQTFKGHTDCVRSVAVTLDNEFLSASNDGTVRRWSMVNGQCLSVWPTHVSYVYGVANLPKSIGGFVTVGEDRTLRLWTDDGQARQIIHHPAQSVWSVGVLPNGDVITGSSDGIARLFSCDVERQASADELIAYEADVGSTVLSSGELGDIKINELPGKEVLYEPGKRDGQTKLIRDGSKVGVYQWIGSETRWMKIGDAVGAAGTQTQQPGNKVHFQGKEYDYVFDVDIEDGKPALKLPYNVTEDPWFAAQKFLETNDISQMFLDQVAKFIMKNTEGMTLGQQQTAITGDPFTGEARYIPGESHHASNGGATADPFTGVGRYVPSSSGHYEQNSPKNSGNSFFPQKILLTFDSANTAAISSKLKEFCTGSGDVTLTIEEIDDVVKLADVNALNVNVTALNKLRTILNLSKERIFPALDLLRLAIRNTHVCEYFCCVSDDFQFITFLLDHLTHENSSANQMLVMRTLCNLSKSCCRLLERGRNSIMGSAVQLVVDSTSTINKNVQIALASLLLNYAVLLTSGNDVEAKAQCLSGIACVFKVQIGNLIGITDQEAQFRLLVAVGTLIHNDNDSMNFARSLDLLPIICIVQRHTPTDVDKLIQCANAIHDLLT